MSRATGQGLEVIKEVLNSPTQAILFVAGIVFLLHAAGIRIPPFEVTKDFKRWLSASFGCILILMGLALEVWKSPQTERIIMKREFKSAEESASRLGDSEAGTLNLPKSIEKPEETKRHYIRHK